MFLLTALGCLAPGVARAFSWGLDLGVLMGARMDELEQITGAVIPEIALRTGRPDRNGVVFDLMALPLTLTVNYQRIIRRNEDRTVFVTAGGGVGTLVLLAIVPVGAGIGYAQPWGDHWKLRLESRYQLIYSPPGPLDGSQSDGTWIGAVQLRAGWNS